MEFFGLDNLLHRLHLRDYILATFTLKATQIYFSSLNRAYVIYNIDILMLVLVNIFLVIKI
jgi:hypothetical protein